LSHFESVGKKISTILVDAGFGKLENLARTDPDVLAELKGIGKKKAAQIVEEAKKALHEKHEKKASNPQQ